jgi:YgiT-type zinc finger domain-containing protein
MGKDRLDERWRERAEEVQQGLADWRAAHPQATFREIEAALDERLTRMKARLLEEAALASAAADLGSQAGADRPRCRECGETLQPRGQRTRRLTIRGDQTVELRRSYAVCPACGAGHFPPG